MFFKMNGGLYKRLLALDHGAWVISYDEPGVPQYITDAFLEICEKAEMPEAYRIALEQAKHLTEAEMKRLALIEPLLEDSLFIIDGKSRLAMAKNFVGTPLAEELFLSQEHLKRRTRGLRLLPLKPGALYREFLKVVWAYQFT